MEHSVRKVIEVMKENMRHRLSLADLAGHAQLSPRHFSHLFRAETGTTPARFLKSLRMQQAKDLLEHSCLATREIIRRVGLSNESHFARDFKRFYGVTPGQFRLAAHLARRDEERPEAAGAGQPGGDVNASPDGSGRG